MKGLTKISMTIALIATISTASFGNTNPLTDEQELLLSVNLEQKESNIEAFRSTLDVFQLAILDNTELSGRKKHESIKSSLTIEQAAILEANRVLGQIMREDFRNSLTDAQKSDVRGTIRESLDMEQAAILEAEKVLHEIMNDNHHELRINRIHRVQL
ncbi:MAG: hypothetical protein ACFHWX_16045 [Bacteroidota bacterium]